MNKLITISSVLLTATAVKAQSPNVIFILADDLGYGDISAFNPESKIHTPNIDNLTHSGISFTDAHSSSALSTPSRYSIITGRYPWRTTMKQHCLYRKMASWLGLGISSKCQKQTGCGFLTPYQEWSYGQRIRLFLRHTCFTRNSSTRLCRKR